MIMVISDFKKLRRVLQRKRHIDCFYTTGRIIRLDELGQTFVMRLVIRVKCKDGPRAGHKRALSVQTSYLLLCVVEVASLPKFVQTHNASSSIKTAVKIELCVGLSVLRLFLVGHVVQNTRSVLLLVWHECFSFKGTERFAAASPRFC